MKPKTKWRNLPACVPSTSASWKLALLFLLLGAISDLAADSLPEIIGDRAPTVILRTMPSDTPPNQRLEGLRFIAGYEVIGQPVPLTPAQAGRLAKAIKDPAASDTTQNEERMRPGVAYRFGTGADAVDLLVCFSCDKIAAIPPGAGAITNTHHITQATRDVLLGLAKELLPQDEAVQELPRVRSEHPIPAPAVPVPKDVPRPGQSSS